MNYTEFLQRKATFSGDSGFDVQWMPDLAKPFQQSLIEWSCRKGRSEIAADCGLGKTMMQLTYAQNVVMKTNERVLVATPLAVGPQTLREAEKFGIEAGRSRDGKLPKEKIVVTNYEQLEKFNPADFVGFVGDEASILKNFDGKTKAAVTEFVRLLPYRLLCTATPAPNDYIELGTSSEALGELGYMDMITRFFKKEEVKYECGLGRKDEYRLRHHAQTAFWKWVCSWMRACRLPSDLGFSDDGYVLPELIQREHEVKASLPMAGRLFDIPAQNLEEQREEQKRTVPERCEKAAELSMKHGKASVLWCYRNDEGDLLEKLLTDCVQVSGKDSDEEKEEKMTAFTTGQVKRIVIKPKIGAWGLNWQHCHHETFFPSHSYEQIYQGIARCRRFGQKENVIVDMVTTDGGAKVLANYKKKAAAAELMFVELVRNMNESNRITSSKYGTNTQELPGWLSSSKS